MATPRALRWVWVCALASSWARAQTEPGRVTVIAQTDVPLHLGGGLGVGLGRRLQLTSVVGAAPRPYLSLTQDVVYAAASLPAAQAAALREVVESVVAWRTHVSWNVWRGLDVAAGYGLLVVSGDVSTGLAQQLAGVDLGASGVPAPLPTVLRAWLHQLDLEVAWRWVLTDGLTLRVGVGVGVTVYGDTALSARYSARDESAATRDAQALVAARVSDALAQWRAVPWVTVGLALNLTR